MTAEERRASREFWLANHCDVHHHFLWCARTGDEVCLIDQTRVLFRFSESQQASLHFGSEAEAVFRMSRHPKRDIFEFADGKQITLDDLPAGLIFDVLAVPGSEQLSGVLNMEPAVRDEEKTEKEPLFA